jgi:hypothetical protein
MIVGTTVRYLAGRGAVQTVYWVGDGSGGKVVKSSRVLTFAGKNEATENISPKGILCSQHNRSRLHCKVQIVFCRSTEDKFHCCNNALGSNPQTRSQSSVCLLDCACRRKQCPNCGTV